MAQQKTALIERQKKTDTQTDKYVQQIQTV